jgi:CCR4-NOT transcription complex subunit 1
MYDRSARHYADWVRLYQRSPQLEKAFVGWVTQLTAQGILKGEGISSFFCRVCVEACVTIYSELINIGDHVNAFQPGDALARLIVLMIKYNGDTVATKVHYLTKFLSIVVVVLAHLHKETGVNFLQKLFSAFSRQY